MYFNIKYLPAAFKCNPTIEIVAVTILSALTICGMAVVSIFKKSMIFRVKALILVSKIFSLCSLMSMPFFIVLLFESNIKCLPTSVTVANEIAFRILFFAGLGVLFSLIKGLYRYFKLRKEMKRARKEFENMYENAKKPGYDMRGFLTKHKKMVVDLELTDKEVQVLWRECTVQRTADSVAVTIADPHANTGSVEGSAECIICLDEMDREYIKHPGCIHCYHKECIGEWVKKKPSCPTCKRSTRLNLVIKLRNQVMNRAPDRQ